MNNLIKNLNKFIRNDPYVVDILDSANLELENIKASGLDLRNQFSFSTMTWGADLLANEMGLKLDPTLTQDVKNSIVAGYWKSDSKCNLELLQTICNSWKNGAIEVTFQNAVIIITFVSLIGIPEDIEALRQQIIKAKPAHLGLEFKFKYRRHEELVPYTHQQLGAYTHNILREGVM